MGMCAVALVMLLDVSGSVNDERYRLQQQGLATALQDPQLAHVVESLPEPLAVSILEWSDRSQVIVNWQIVRTGEDMARVARRVQAHTRSLHIGGQTAVGQALESGLDMFATEPCEPERRVIDISSDGENNQGADPRLSQARAIEQMVTINALPILSEEGSNLEEYYRQRVATPDGFVLVAQGFHDFARAIRRKLVLEITHRWPDAPG